MIRSCLHSTLARVVCRPSIPTAAVRKNACYLQQQQQQQQQKRYYSRTWSVWGSDGRGGNRGNGDGNDEDDTQDFGDIQTFNAGEMSEEDIQNIIKEQLTLLREREESKYVPNWKPGMRRRPLKVSYKLEDFEYELDPNKERKWTLLDKRCGVLAIKVGMMPVYDHWGVRYPCTILALDHVRVLGHKTMEQHGYSAVQLVAGQRKRKNVSAPLLGQYQGLLDPDEPAPYLVREFRVSDEAHFPPIGSTLHARHFVPGQNVDIAGISKGKGFQGGMKRHNFKGMPASHGVSKSHRALGSTGQCQDPGKVFKGKKMPGRMGTDRVTVQNLRVLKVDRGRDLIYIVGAVPGNKGHFVEIRDAVKNPLWRTDKVLNSLTKPPLPTFEYDEAIDGCGELGHEEFMPLSETNPLEADEEAA